MSVTSRRLRGESKNGLRREGETSISPIDVVDVDRSPSAAVETVALHGGGRRHGASEAAALLIV